MKPSASYSHALGTSEEVVRVDEYGSPTDSLVIFIAGYYTGTDALAPLAMSLARDGWHVAIIEPFGAPTWIDPHLPFTTDIPPILQAWVSGAQVALLELQSRYPEATIHLVGFSFGGPAATLLNEYNQRIAKTLTLIAPVGTQGPLERLALALRRTVVCIPVAVLLEYSIIYAQILRVRVQKRAALKLPELYERYQVIMADQAKKLAEGANLIGLDIARAKLQFKLADYLTSGTRTQVHLIAHTNDAYISLGAMRRLATHSGAQLSVTAGTHNRAKDHPDEIGALVKTFLQANS